MCKRQSLMWQKLFIFNKSGFRSRYFFSLSDQWDPRIKIMLVRRFGSGIYHEFSSLVKLQGLNYSNLSVMRMKIKVFQCFSWWTKKKKKMKKQHGKTQIPWSSVVQVLVGGGGHLGSNCCFPQWSPAANIWAPRWRWMFMLPANDTRTVACHCLLVGLSTFLYNSVITGHRNPLRSPAGISETQI